MATSQTNGHGSTPVDILLIGLGSIGSIYAYILERSGRARVTAVARSNYSLYAEKGVTLDMERFGLVEGWRPHRVVKSQAEALASTPHFAFCIVCTKCLPDVTPTPELVKDAIESGKIGAWSLIQNGIAVEEHLYNAVSRLETPIISSMAWIGIMTSSDGSTVTWKGKDCLVSGLYPSIKTASSSRVVKPREQEAMNSWCELLGAGEGYVYPTDELDAVRYAKNVWNAAWSSIQGLVRATPWCFSPLEPAVQAPIKRFIREIVDTGFQAGLLREGMVQYPGMETMGGPDEVAEHAWSRIMSVSIAKMKSSGGGHKMSLLIDVEMGRPIEVEVITGAVLRIAQAHGTDTPLLEYTYSLLKGLQVEILRRRGLVQP